MTDNQDTIELSDRAELARMVAGIIGLDEQAFVRACLLNHYGQSPLKGPDALHDAVMRGGFTFGKLDAAMHHVVADLWEKSLRVIDPHTDRILKAAVPVLAIRLLNCMTPDNLLAWTDGR